MKSRKGRKVARFKKSHNGFRPTENEPKMSQLFTKLLVDSVMKQARNNK